MKKFGKWIENGSRILGNEIFNFSEVEKLVILNFLEFMTWISQKFKMEEVLILVKKIKILNTPKVTDFHFSDRKK